MADGLKLGGWILANASAPRTHLKIQKLAFYCYGAALAHGYNDVGEIDFSAWKHGPVSVQIWDRLKQFGGAEIDAGHLPEGSYSVKTQRVLRNVLAVYDRMSAWELRCESHLEAPWKDVTVGDPITSDSIRKHFKRKLLAGRVAWPTFASGHSSYALDGLPVKTFASFEELANASRLAG